MTETITAAQTTEFESYADYVARAMVGDSFRDELDREITDWTVTGIQRDSDLSPRLVHLAGITTRHHGTPHYCYETRQVTQRADGIAPAYCRSVIIGRHDLNRSLGTVEARRFSTRGLAAAHASRTAY